MYINESNLKFGSNMSYGNNPEQIVLHHAEATNCSVYDVHNWHLEKRWAGCGYHFFVRKDGSIWRGRPENAIGSHCPGANENSIGVCAEGNYMFGSMPEVQRRSIVQLGLYLKGKYPINRVVGHGEIYSTECPGTNYPLSSLKSDIMGGSASVSVNESTSSNTSTSQSTGSDYIRRLQSACNDQRFSNQRVDGWFGPNTLNGCPMVRQGARGEITKLLQEKLNSLGYGTNGIDGIFGQGTYNAVSSFQRDRGIGVDGIVGQGTWNALLS